MCTKFQFDQRMRLHFIAIFKVLYTKNKEQKEANKETET